MARRRRKLRETAPSTLDLPIAEEGAITETTIYPTIAAAFEDAIGGKPWFPQYSPGTQRTLKYAFYTAVAEALRTIAFRMNSEQSDSVFTDFGREIEAYDAELKQSLKDIDAELH
jgi:hypothetical protein